jgi:hypothetical protein
MAGAKSMWVKKAESHDRPVYTIAYRNGHGGVTLASSTEYGGYDWDMVMQNPGDREWYEKLQSGNLSESEVLYLCYQPLNAKSKKDKISKELVSLLCKHPIKPLTTVQSSGQDWFFLRLYGLSSRSVDKAYSVYKGNEKELKHPAAWRTTKTYIETAAKRCAKQAATGNTQDEQRPAEVDDDDDDHGNDNNGGDDGDRASQQLIFEKLMNDDAYAEEQAQEVERDDDDDNDTSRTTVIQIKVILELLGAKPSIAQSDITKLRNDNKTFVNWCRLHPLLRPVYYQKVVKLRVFAGALEPPCVQLIKQ